MDAGGRVFVGHRRTARVQLNATVVIPFDGCVPGLHQRGGQGDSGRRDQLLAAGNQAVHRHQHSGRRRRNKSRPATLR